MGGAGDSTVNLWTLIVFWGCVNRGGGEGGEAGVQTKERIIL